MADRTSDRWIEVDDTDSRIQYSGEWFSDSYTTPGRIQASGDLNKGTARGTNSAGVLSFRYQGVPLFLSAPECAGGFYLSLADPVFGVSQAAMWLFGDL